MKVLVAGGAGYVGSVTTQILCNNGYDVVVFDNLERGYKEAIDSRALFIKGDLRNKKEIMQAMERELPDAVIHFAAYIEVGESMRNPIPFFENNVIGSVHLIEAMAAFNCKKLIFSSTCAIYGSPKKIPMDESLSYNPLSVYGESKVMCENIFKWIGDIHDIDYIFLRYFNASGASNKYGEAHIPESHLIPLILQVAQNKKDKIYIYGDSYDTPDGTCIRDYIHIEDLAQAHILALKSNKKGAYNLGNGNGYSVKEVIDVCREITGHPIPTEIVDAREGDCPILVADASKAYAELNWRPEFPSLKTIIESAWKWHQSYPEGYIKGD